MFNKFKLSKFCSEHRGLLLNLAYSWCHDKAMAEDLLQDATVKALKNISSIKHTKAIKAWFIQIMLNCWRDILRKKQEHQNIDDLIFNDAADLNPNQALYENLTPEESLSATQTQEVVRSAISRLPIKYRTVVTLVDIYGATYLEVAEIIEAPLGTVMSRLSRARQELVKSLSNIESNQTVVPLHNNSVLRGEQ